MPSTLLQLSLDHFSSKTDAFASQFTQHLYLTDLAGDLGFPMGPKYQEPITEQ